MIHIDNFDKIKKRYDAYWAKENHDRPLMDIRAPQYDYRSVFSEKRENLYDQWMDTEYVVRRERALQESLYFAGEAYPLVCPNLGPDVFGAYFGCGITFGEDTSWASSHVEKLEDIDVSCIKEDNIWFRKTVELTKAMLDDSSGDYLVGITDIHPGLDGLVSLRGPQELCFDIFEEPELVQKLNFEMCMRFKEVYNRLNDILQEKQQGNSNWMGIYHQQGWYVTSCDFGGMISEEMYQQFVIPELKEEIGFLKHTIFHLDGPGALRQLDSLLELEGLDGIQWVYGAGQPTAAYWIETLKKIQDAGKMIHIDIVKEDLPVLLEQLRPEGVLYRMNCSTPEEADYLIKTAGEYRGKKVF